MVFWTQEKLDVGNKKESGTGKNNSKLRVDKNDVPQDIFVSKLREKGYKVSSYPRSAYDNAPADITSLFSFIFSPEQNDKNPNYEDFQYITDTYVIHITW